MDDLYFRMFHGQLGRECKFALMASESMKNASGKMFAPPFGQYDLGELQDEFWYSVDAFLTATANISKIFWPSVGEEDENRERIETRCYELRLKFAIRDDSPFSQRKMRNHFEHFDERIDTWFYSSEHHNVIDSWVAQDEQSHQMTFDGFAKSDFLRVYIVESNTLLFVGDRLELEPLIDALKFLQSKLTENHYAAGTS